MRHAAPFLARSKSSPRERKKRELPKVIDARDLRRILPGSHARHEQLVDACEKYLNMVGVPAIPVYTGPRVRPREGGGFDLRPNRANVGISDLVGPLPVTGRMLLVECKTGKAQRSPEQESLRNRFEAAGALCLLIRDIQELHVIIEPQRAMWRAMAAAKRQIREEQSIRKERTS